jgi:phage tail protein X
MRVTRTRRALQDGDTAEILCVRIFAPSQGILNALLLDAKRIYEKEEQHRVSIYTVSALVLNDLALTLRRLIAITSGVELDHDQNVQWNPLF